ncbi:Protocadherin-16 [Acipenser ruthenus]|uniref:Protocadherin-16 n=1 Tax=Acipenser ruthenus TaxID=7906 RepID=A0A444U5R5_ACIRT|nr:Protocadherin-16 [Acipenser ruthenus]
MRRNALFFSIFIGCCIASGIIPTSISNSCLEEEETSIARSLAERWTELGLTDVHFVNYTVLLSLPGSTPNTITAKDRGQCFLPNGTPYDTESHTPYHIDQLYSYVAYSAKGAEVIDVQYGTLDDLIQAHAATNVANKIALLKLGHVPLLYKRDSSGFSTHNPMHSGKRSPASLKAKRTIILHIESDIKYMTIHNVIGYLKGITDPVRNGWQPDRATVFCSWEGSAFSSIGSYEWAERLSLNCTRRGKCSRPDVSSVQTQGDVDFFANQLGIPTMVFVYWETKTGEPLDRERIASYYLTIEARDHGTPQLSSIASVVVKVLDVNDNNPMFKEGAYTIDISEDAPIGTLVLDITATDADDGTNGMVLYYLSNESLGMFNVNQETGKITTADLLDREKRAAYSFLVNAVDSSPAKPRNASARVTVNIKDVNDNSPFFIQDPLIINISSSVSINQVVATMRAEDKDFGANASIFYRFASLVAGFSINSFTGEIRLVAPLSSMTQMERTLYVVATDQGTPAQLSTGVVVIYVKEEDYRGVRFPRSARDVSLQENAASGLPVTIAHSGLQPFLVSFVIGFFMQLSGTESILMQDVGDRDSVLNTAEEEEETEDADRGLLSKNKGENPEEECVPNLHILGVLFLSKYMSYAFNLLLVFQFYVYVIPFFTWILALGILVAQVVIQPVTSLLTLLKGTLLIVTVAVTFVVGSEVKQEISNDFSYVGKPFLMGTVALGGVVNVMPFLFSEISHNKSQIMWFRRAVFGGLATCAVLNILWCWAVLKIVPQMSVRKVLEDEILNNSMTFSQVTVPVYTFIYSNISLEESEKLGEIATIPLTKGFVVMLDKVASFTLNLEAGLFVFLMLRKSRSEPFIHFSVPLPVSERLFTLHWILPVYFLFAVGYDIFQSMGEVAESWIQTQSNTSRGEVQLMQEP